MLWLWLGIAYVAGIGTGIGVVALVVHFAGKGMVKKVL